MEFWKSIAISGASGAFTAAIVGVVGYFAGIKKYYDQRKSERIQERYIEKGFLEPISVLAQSLELCNFNYVKAGSIVGLLRTHLRDATMQTFQQQIETLESDYSEMALVNSPKFFLVNFFDPTGENKIIWEWVVRAEAEIQNYLQGFRGHLSSEIHGCVEKVAKGELVFENPDEYIDQLVKDLLEKHQQVVKHYSLIGHMNRVAEFLESNNPKTITELRGLKEKDEFKKIMSDMKNEYHRLFPSDGQ